MTNGLDTRHPLPLTNSLSVLLGLYSPVIIFLFWSQSGYLRTLACEKWKCALMLQISCPILPDPPGGPRSHFLLAAV